MDFFWEQCSGHSLSKEHGHLWKPNSPINILELRAVQMTLLHWARFLWAYPGCSQTMPPRIWLTSTTKRAPGVLQPRRNQIISWTECHCPVISVVHSSAINSWKVDCLRRYHLNEGPWALQPEISQLICQKLRTLDVNILAFRYNSKLPLFVAKSKQNYILLFLVWIWAL